MFRDNKNTFDYAKESAYSEGKAEGIASGIAAGKAEGIAVGKAEGIAAGKKESMKYVAEKLKEKGMDTDFIMETTGLTRDEIGSL